jgi:hypothetical protein
MGAFKGEDGERMAARGDEAAREGAELQNRR